MFIVDDSRKIIIITFAKSGCTTLRKAMTRLMYPALSETEVASRHHRIQQQHIEFSKLATYHVVCVYRNTFKRLTSIFTDKVLQFPTSMSEKYVPRYTKRKMFSKFITYLSKTMHLLDADVHFQPQYVSNSVAAYVNEYVDIDKLDTIFAHNTVLQNEFLRACTKENYARKRTDITVPLAYYDFAEDPLGLMQDTRVPSYRNFYNNTLIEQVKIVFSDEIQRFGITYPWKRDYTFISNTCSGWTLERDYKREEYTNPFIGSLIPNDYHYVKLCEQLDYYMTQPPVIVRADDIDLTSSWHQQTGRARWLIRDTEKVDYIITKLDDIEVHWIHETDPVAFMDKYERRRARYRDSIPIFTWTEQQTFLDLPPKERQALRDRFQALPSYTMLAVRDTNSVVPSSLQHQVEYPYTETELSSTLRNGNGNFALPVSEGTDTTLRRMFHRIQSAISN